MAYNIAWICQNWSAGLLHNEYWKCSGFRLIIAYSHSKVKMLFDDFRMLMKLLLIAHILILMIYVNMGKCKALLSPEGFFYCRK